MGGIESSSGNETIESPANSRPPERATPRFDEMSPEQQARVKKVEEILLEMRANEAAGKGTPEEVDAILNLLEEGDNLGVLIERAIDQNPELRGTNGFQESFMQPIKNTVFPQSEKNGYDIGSFFNGDIVEDTVIFYSTDPRFGEIEIAVNPGMEQQEIGNQILQGLIQASSTGEYDPESDEWELVTQIETQYGVSWNSAREMS